MYFAFTRFGLTDKPSTTASMNNKRKHLLVLEDEVLLAKNIAKYLVKHGYTASTAGTVLDATRQLREARIDALLLDINLPDCNGLDFFEHIRPDYVGLRAIAMSGKDTSIQRGRARDLGINIFLAKPFPLSRMLAVVNSLFKLNGGNTPPTGVPDTGANVFPGDETTMTAIRDVLSRYIWGWQYALNVNHCDAVDGSR
jgi:DNA-binding response OmpR family regulator